jgi:hypothetical protein
VASLIHAGGVDDPTSSAGTEPAAIRAIVLGPSALTEAEPAQ